MKRRPRAERCCRAPPHRQHPCCFRRQRRSPCWGTRAAGSSRSPTPRASTRPPAFRTGTRTSRRGAAAAAGAAAITPPLTPRGSGRPGTSRARWYPPRCSPRRRPWTRPSPPRTPGATLSTINSIAWLVVPVPGAPTDVSAVQSGDQFQVTWAANANPAAVTSSTLTATPADSSLATLTANVTGPAASGLIGPLQPQTAYAITVVSTTIGGSSAASAPITVTTGAASVPPSAPTGVAARWAVADPSGDTDTLASASHRTGH